MLVALMPWHGPFAEGDDGLEALFFFRRAHEKRPADEASKTDPSIKGRIN
jgi:hypothetical protein